MNAERRAWLKANDPVTLRRLMDENNARYRKHCRLNPEKHRFWRKAWEESRPAARLWSSASKRSRRLGIEFSITKADVVVPTHCPVLGLKLERGAGIGGAIDASPTLDRIRNDLGYVPGNVWVISNRANRIKNDSTLAELRLLVKALEARQQ